MSKAKEAERRLKSREKPVRTPVHELNTHDVLVNLRSLCEAEPEGPTMARNSPRATWMETPRRAATFTRPKAYTLVRLSAAMMGGDGREDTSDLVNGQRHPGGGQQPGAPPHPPFCQ
ncbi:MAG TPA: hypothetical protein VMI06_02300 [Terriglobia bacterium]|nr:hypothetical protein [Terriglobia bacterium]